MDSKLPQIDRFSFVRPACWAALGLLLVLIFVCLDVLRAFSDRETESDFLYFLPFLLLILLVLAIDWIIALAVNLWRRRWRRLVSAFVAPAFLLVPLGASRLIDVSPRFLIERPRLQRAVDALPGPRGSRYLEIAWDDRGFVGSVNMFDTMVFDETDAFPRKFAIGETRWSPEWAIVRSMGGHFYLVIENVDEEAKARGAQ